MIDKLVEKIKKTGAPIEVGLDPMLDYVPEFVKQKAYEEQGETLEGAAEAIWQFNKAIIDAVYDLIPAVKPQIAMYEQFGIPGIMAFKKTLDYCHEKDLIVIGDIKRGDIGSTSGAYATGHLGRPGWEADPGMALMKILLRSILIWERTAYSHLLMWLCRRKKECLF